jgi:arsenate reductase (thioredoxin)
MVRVVFACVQNAGRSQMAAAFFNELADPAKARAVSAGTRPAAAVHDAVVTVMREAGVDLSSAAPRHLSAALAEPADWLITMGCGEECPVVPGAARDDWPVPDPAHEPMERVRDIRDAIRRKVGEFVTRHGYNPPP